MAKTKSVQELIYDEVDRRARSQDEAFELQYRSFLYRRYPLMTYTPDEVQVWGEIGNIIARFGPQSADWIIEAAQATSERIQGAKDESRPD